MQWEMKTCCVDADSASYISFTERGSNKTKSGIFVVYTGLHVDVKCVGDVNEMGRVRTSGINVMFLFRNKGSTR